jgi:hypothetical protein
VGGDLTRLLHARVARKLESTRPSTPAPQAPWPIASLDARHPAPVRDASAAAAELRAAVGDGNAAGALAVLADHAEPAARYALRAAYGPLERDLYLLLGANDWARARAYLGDQLALEWQLDTRDTRDEIFADLERVTDQQAASLFVPHLVPLAAPGLTSAPAPAELRRVKEVLARRLNADDHDAALHLLLAKAERALGPGPVAFDDVPAGLTVWSAASALATERLDLAELALRRYQSRLEILQLSQQQLAQAERVYTTPPGVELSASQAVERAITTAPQRWSVDSARSALGDFSTRASAIVADLSRDERAALAGRLTGSALAVDPTVTALLAESDDRAAIERALVATGGAGPAGKVALDAARRFGERAQAQREAPADPRGAYFHADATAAYAAIADASSDRDTLAARLHAMGASPKVIARARVDTIPAVATATLLDAIAATPPAARDALVPALRDRLFLLGPAQRDYARALLAGNVDPSALPPELRPGADYDLEFELALAMLVDALTRGPAHAPQALALLHRAGPALRRRLIADPRFEAAYQDLPSSSQAERDEKTLIGVAIDRVHVERSGRVIDGGIGQTPADAIRSYPGPTGIWQEIGLEELRLGLAEHGAENVKRAWVLREHARARGDTSDASLLPWQRDALTWFDERVQSSLFDRGSQALAEELVFGQPDFAAIDLTVEVDLLRFRLGRTIGLAPDRSLASWSGDSPPLVEALTAFDSLYQRRRWGTVTPADLAELYQLSLRATDAHAAWVRAKEANESWARTVATVVAAVVATVVVTVASGGTLTGPTIAALAALSGGASAAAAGAIVRDDDTVGSVATDFGAGAVEGLVAAVGGKLASKVARGIAGGRPIGVAAAEIGANAVRHTTGLGTAVVESVIDGALGGAASEVFRTAVDDIEWDRGVASALSALLTAIGRGASEGALGGALGGTGVHALGRVWHTVASSFDARTARTVTQLLERSQLDRAAIEALDDGSAAALARAVEHVNRGDLAAAERALAELRVTPAQRDLLVLQLRTHSLQGGVPGLAMAPPGTDLTPHLVSDAAFRKATGGRMDRHAAIIFQDGVPRILARKGAPVSALREELVHLGQYYGDPLMAARMRSLDEAALANWSSLPREDRVEFRLAQLEVEADAQRRLMALHEGPALHGDPTAIAEYHTAAETLTRLGEQLDLAYAAKAGVLTGDLALGLYDDAPRLYATSPHGRAPSKRQLRRIAALHGRDPAEVTVELRALGYTPHGRAPITSLHRREGHGGLPALTISDGQIAPGRGRTSFAEEAADAAALWRRQTHDRDALVRRMAAGGIDGGAAAEHLEHLDSTWRTLLAKRVTDNTLDEAGAGLLSKWGPLAEHLEARTGGAVSLARLLDEIPAGDITSTRLSSFRKALRRAEVDHIHSLPVELRRAALDDLLARQPDQASKGHLFSDFRTESFARLEDEFGDPLVASFDDVTSFHGADLTNRRTPDGALTIAGHREGFLPPGTYAFEDKVGPGAFKIEQARDYARRFDPTLPRRTPGPFGEATGGFRAGPTGQQAEYDGVVFAFANEDDATSASILLKEDPITASATGRHPGISIFYLDTSGSWIRQ